MVRWTKRKNKTNDPDDAQSVASEVESVTTLDDLSEELTRDDPPLGQKDQVERKNNDREYDVTGRSQKRRNGSSHIEQT